MYWKKTLTTIKQYAFPRTTALERELVAARAENAAVAAALEHIRAEFASVREHDAQQISELGRQLGDLAAERRADQKQIELLDASLQEAQGGRQAAEQQIRDLEERLVAEHNQHESSLQATRETLGELQSEQQQLLTLQSNLARTFNDFGRQLLESLPLDAARPKQPVLPIAAIASLLFLAVLLVGAVTVRGFQDGTRVLSDVGQGIRDLQISIKHHISKQDELLHELTEALNRDTARATMAPADVSGREAVDRLGPPLLLPDQAADEPGGAVLFDPQVKNLQTDLLTLGFNIGHLSADGRHGPQTQQALEEFRILYLPLTDLEDEADDAQLVAAVSEYAALAREDEQRYGIDSGVVAAIRLASLRTGVEFPFLMELAAVESTFDPTSSASGSSAAGLYQFRGSTWLESVRLHGEKYGIGEYAGQVEYVVSSEGRRQPVIHDPHVAQHVLDLRYNPRIASLLASEYILKNMSRLSYSLDREPGRTDLYLTHFLGAAGAISFLRLLDEAPDEIADNVFPGAAKRNSSIFSAGQSRPRTVSEVYELFSRKFNTARYAEGNPG